jgi:DNA-binding transcriptional LysR family regulator
MDLDQLGTFLAIAQLGTVTAAARKLHRSQSAISRRLSLLEQDLGAPLFDRGSSALALTNVGQAFLPFAESALAAVASAQEAARAQLAPRAGSVSLAIVGTLIDAPLANALGKLLRSPLKLTVLTTTSAEVSRLVRRGEANLGVRYFADDAPDVVAREIGVERMCVVASPRHRPSTAKHKSTPNVWIGFPLTRTSKEDLGRLLHRQLTAAGLSDANVMAVDSLSAQKRLVEAGVGVSLLPKSSVREELRRRTLSVVDVPRMSTTIPIVLVTRRDSYVSPAARELTALLEQTFKVGQSSAAVSGRSARVR